MIHKVLLHEIIILNIKNKLEFILPGLFKRKKKTKTNNNLKCIKTTDTEVYVEIKSFSFLT